MSKKQKPVEIIAILDGSGSMEMLKNDTIGGYNSFIEEQKKIKGIANVSLVFFSNEINEVYSRENIKNVKSLTSKEYYTSGSTSLYDAIGYSILKMSKIIDDMDTKEKPEKIIMLITTDGEENSSKEFSHSKIKELIELKQKEGWEIIFIGANIDVKKEGSKIGTTRNISYVASSEGTNMLYKTINSMVSEYRNTGEITEIKTKK